MPDAIPTLDPPAPAPDGSPPDRSPLARARLLAGNLCSTVRLSNALAGTRRPVDLAGLDASVGLLCAKALDLDPAQGRMLLPELRVVLDELAVLSGTLAERGPNAHRRPLAG